ncbi:TPA: site-specific DNA-methyltransferase, partial [Mannheimia haemolytica]|nr:site-specific DNA-methyltransferase [Mannheimia haemolytica]HDV7274915.1 site-specific DNA-methyltransferase [Mannheimia haemolytica]
MPFYAGQVKCIFIDPPYNTKSAFTHYDDNLEHSIWLSMMYPRLEILRELLAEDGSIWITLDDNESHYLKIMLDEIFGRKNFISNLIWEKKRKPSFLGKVGKVTDNLFCYAKNKNELNELNDLTYLETSGDETYPLYNAGNSREILVFPPRSIKFKKHSDGLYKPTIFSKKTSSITLISELIIEDQWNKNTVEIEGEWRYSQKSIDEQLKNGDYYIIKSLDFRPRRVFERSAEKKKIH